jgi:leucyl-tRNA synthetase
MSEEDIRQKALEDKAIIEWVGEEEVKRVIYVKGRLVNIVV